MGSTSKPTSGSLPMRKTGRRSSSRRRTCDLQKSQRPLSGPGAPAHSSVSDKLEALKQLIPSHHGEIKADQLFQETADYIVLLRTQVLVLQKLIDFYGLSNKSGSQPQTQDTQNAV